MSKMANETNSSTKVRTGVVRASYVNLLKPVAMQDGSGAPKYSVSLIIDPNTDEGKATIAAIEAAVEAAIQDGMKTKWKGKRPANLKLPLRDGSKDRSDNPEYEGMKFVTASSKERPGLVDRKVQKIIDETEVYSGMYVKASLNFFPFDTKGNKGVGCGLNHVQKVKDGEPLGGRGRAEDEFEMMADDEEVSLD